MKTLVIFDGFGENRMTYGIVEGDLRHLNYKYINLVETTEKETDEIDALAKRICVEGEVDEWYVHELPEFPSDKALDAIREGAFVIVTGCIP
jgi:hypothetical protein